MSSVAVQYKALAIELLGSVIQLVGNHSRLASLPLAVDLENQVDDEDVATSRGYLDACSLSHWHHSHAFHARPCDVQTDSLR